MFAHVEADFVHVSMTVGTRPGAQGASSVLLLLPGLSNENNGLHSQSQVLCCVTKSCCSLAYMQPPDMLPRSQQISASPTLGCMTTRMVR